MSFTSFLKRKLPQSLDRIFILFLFILFLLSWLFAGQAPILADEAVHHKHAQKVNQYFKTKGANTEALSDPQDLLHNYGQSLDYIALKINQAFGSPNNIYNTRHRLNAIVCILCLLLTYLIGKQIAGPRLAFIAALLLFAFPRFTGQAFGNSLDIPFALGFLLCFYALLLFIKSLPELNWKACLLIAIGIGLAFSIRAGALILFPFSLLLIGLAILEKRQTPQTEMKLKNVIIGSLIFLIPTFLVAYFLGIARWPYALQDPFLNPIRALSELGDISNRIRVLYNGEQLWSNELPWHYYPKWFFIGSPLVFLAGLLFALGHLIRSRSKTNSVLWFGIGFLALFPILYVILTKAAVYNGIRHLLFTVPFLAIIAAFGWNRLFIFAEHRQNKRLRTGFFALFCIGLCIVFFRGIQQWPHQYIYFNELSGGLKAAHGNFQTDYFQSSIKPAVKYLSRLPQKDTLLVLTNGQRSGKPELKLHRHGAKIKMRYENFYQRNSRNWDYGIFYTDYILAEHLQNPDYKVWPPKGTVKTISPLGVPLCVIIKRENRDALEGIKALKKGRDSLAIPLFKSALEFDPSDFNTHYILGSTLAKNGDFQEAKTHLMAAAKGHSELQVAFVELAALLIEEKRYAQATRSLEPLFKKFPESEEVQQVLSRALYLNNQKKEAIEVYQKAIGIQPKNPKLYFRVGEILVEDSLFSEALQWFGQSNNIDESNPITHFEMARCYHNLGQDDLAEKSLGQSLDLGYQAAELWELQGDIARRKKDLQLASDYFFQGIKSDDSYYPNYEKFAWTLARGKEFKTAEDVIQTAIEKGLGESRPYTVLAALYLAQGKSAKAKEMSKKAAEILNKHNQ